MKIQFEDNSYIEMTRSPVGEKVFVTVAAKSAEQNRTMIINSVEIEKEQLLALIKSLH